MKHFDTMSAKFLIQSKDKVIFGKQKEALEDQVIERGQEVKQIKNKGLNKIMNSILSSKQLKSQIFTFKKKLTVSE